MPAPTATPASSGTMAAVVAMLLVSSVRKTMVATISRITRIAGRPAAAPRPPASQSASPVEPKAAARLRPPPKSSSNP